MAPVDPVVPIPILEVAMTVVRFEVPETFTFVVKTFEAVRAFAMNVLPRTYRLVAPGRAPIPMFEPATIVRRFVVPVIFIFVAKIEAPFRVVTLVVARLEMDVVLRDDAKRLAAFMTRVLLLVKTFRVAMFARVLPVRLVMLAVAVLRVVTLVVERLLVPVTFRVGPKIAEAPRVVTLAVERLEVPEIAKFNSPPL